MIAAWVLCLAIQPAVVPAFAAADEAAAAKALKSLEGKWTGKTFDAVETVWEFKEDTLKVKIGDLDFTAKVKIDPEAKPHPSVDFTLSKPSEFEGRTALAIYRQEEGKLKVCVAMPDNPNRPTVFEAEEGESFVYELKKEEKKD